MFRILNIEQDYLRFRRIVSGNIKQHLRKYVAGNSLIGKKGNDFVSIPVPQIELPNFRFGRTSIGGVGQGDGMPGTVVAPGEQGERSGGAGNDPGDHILEVDYTVEELVGILAEGLNLPRLLPKSSNRILTEKERYSDIAKTGPESLRHFKRTYKEALKRHVAVGIYDPKNPVITPIHEDKRYLSWRIKPKYESNAFILYMMDVSGSMGDFQKEIARIEAGWINAWIRLNYKGTVVRYVIHDAVAQETDEEIFFHTRESGGTNISSAYRYAIRILEEYPEELWNTYLFHFSDGDNASGDDTAVCIQLLMENILPRVNLFGYCQIESTYGTGQFLQDLKVITKFEALVTTKVATKDGIVDSIQKLFGGKEAAT